MSGLTILLAILFISDPLMGNIINVPSDFLLIQEGLDFALEGDTILVEAGTYQENLVINKNITLTSNYLFNGNINTINETVIDGNSQTGVLIQNTNESTKIIGFTVCNADDGFLIHSKCQIISCIIRNCVDGIDYESGGGGVCNSNMLYENSDDGIDLDGDVDIIIQGNHIYENSDDGIEIRLHDYWEQQVEIQIINNIISYNQEDGIQIIDYEGNTNRLIKIEKNLIHNNAMVGIGCMGNGNTIENFEGAQVEEQIIIYNNTLDNNLYSITGGANIIGINNIFSNSIIATYNINGNSLLCYSAYWNNENNYINCILDTSNTYYFDPGFVVVDESDYYLSEESPCIDAGTPLYEWEGDTLLNMGSYEYVGIAPDIGALEFGAIFGCIDPEACNYDDEANLSDFSCEFPKIGYDCNGDELTVENDKPHSDYSLLNVTPNPFNSVIRLNYRVKENDRIKIMIYDITGKKICTLRNGFHSRGFYSISWDANKYSSGIYIVKLFVGEYPQYQQITLLR